MFSLSSYPLIFQVSNWPNSMNKPNRSGKKTRRWKSQKYTKLTFTFNGTLKIEIEIENRGWPIRQTHVHTHSISRSAWIQYFFVTSKATQRESLIVQKYHSFPFHTPKRPNGPPNRHCQLEGNKNNILTENWNHTNEASLKYWDIIYFSEIYQRAMANTQFVEMNISIWTLEIARTRSLLPSSSFY